MRGLALALALFAASGPSVSHFIDPFDQYMDAAKMNKLQPQLAALANECGVAGDAVHPKFAIRQGSWRSVGNFAKSVYDLESDYFTTGEVRNSGKHHFVIVWSADLGTEIRFAYCFDDDGSLRFAQSKVWSLSRPGNVGWAFERRWRMDGSGKLVPESGRFLSFSGKPIAKPKSEADEQTNIDWPGEAKNLADLKLPGSMLQ